LKLKKNDGIERWKYSCHQSNF